MDADGSRACGDCEREVIAALFVQTGGVYFRVPDVDPWDERRDARLYAGPWPVVAHPPCARWGKFAAGGPNARTPRIPGDDGGCFESALASVRKWGGILEHPSASMAWEHFGIAAPDPHGGWSRADDLGGFTCQVEQGHYGHFARKATWLYAIGVDLPALRWGPSEDKVLPFLPGILTHEDQVRYRRAGAVSWMGKEQRAATPIPFRDLLLSIARTARKVAA